MSLCVSTCKYVNASIGNVEHWMCGESWLALKDLKPTIPSSQGWASSVHFIVNSILIWTYNLLLLMSVCVCMWFSKPSRLPVYIQINFKIL